jgi:hypothetical protein
VVEENVRLDLKRRLRRVYNKAWVDEALRDRLIAEPRTVLVEHGITLPATVNVEAELAEAVPNAPRVRLRELLAAWDDMIDQGTVKLKVPASPPAGATELPDEELEGVSGGRHFYDYSYYDPDAGR